MITKTGYQQDTTGSWIPKDPQAQLVYSMDWTYWLQDGDHLISAQYALQVRANDPQPLVKVSEGFSQDANISYVELSGGQVGKIYTVTVTIMTNLGSTDRRSFRVKVENRSA